MRPNWGSALLVPRAPRLVSSRFRSCVRMTITEYKIDDEPIKPGGISQGRLSILSGHVVVDGLRQRTKIFRNTIVPWKRIIFNCLLDNEYVFYIFCQRIIILIIFLFKRPYQIEPISPWVHMYFSHSSSLVHRI